MENKRTQMLNLIAAMCAPLTLFFFVLNISESRYLLSAINLSNCLVSASVFALHRVGRYGTARIMLLGFNFIFFTLGNYFYQNGSIYFLLSILIVSILVYDSKWLQTLFAGSIIAIIVWLTFYPNPAIEADQLSMGRKMMNTVGALFFIAFIIAFFKHIQYDYQAKIEEQHKRLKDINDNMQNLFSIVSHDIKSPLASLQNMLSLFKANLLSAENAQHSINLMNKRVVQLNITLENLLHWSSKNLDGIETHPSYINIRNAVKETCYFFEPLAEQKAITFTINIPEGLFVFADYDQLGIILRNLVSNAIKFSFPNASICLTAKPKGQQVHLQVIDFGTGMEQEKATQLFLHLQSPMFGTDGERGSGVGLLLCSELVRRNGGTITATSNPNQGSIFTVTLPAGVPKSPSGNQTSGETTTKQSIF